MRKILLALLVSSAPLVSVHAQQNDDLLVSTAREWGGEGGVFTCQQWRAYMTRLYRLADRKKRGFIEEKDFDIVRRESSVFATATFDYFDASGKGRITQKEFIESESPFFARFDKKHSCRVTYDDIRAANTPASRSPQQHSGGNPNGGLGAGSFGWRDR